MEATDRRKYPRKNSSIPIEYTVSILELYEMKKVHRSGMTTDISDKGIGLITDYPLEPGHVLIITNHNESLLPNKIAIVRWTMPLSSSYRIGLEFV